jgi:type VI secretion system ImpC/EvpB family protein
MDERLAERVPSLAVVTADAAPVALPAAAPAEGGPLDAILQAVGGTSGRPSAELGRFLAEPSPARALRHWLGPAALRGPDLKERLALRLGRDTARIDALLNAQVNAILHHPAFQKLESSWRGLHYLVQQVPTGEVEGLKVEVRVLNATWKELTGDQKRAMEFDQSQLFRKVYGEEFGMPGGKPFGVLLGDYEIRHRPGPDHPYDDVDTLLGISAVAAAAFAPFVAGVHPSTLDLGDFTDLERPLNLARTFEQPEYLKWRTFRSTDDARFVGLTLPRVLMRLPYEDSTSRVDAFRFREEVEEPGRTGYLWGNACWAFGTVLVRAYLRSGWLADIRGVQLADGRPVEAGGVVTGLPAPSVATDSPGTVLKCATDVIITDHQEKGLGDLGFIPLCYCQDTGLSVFYGNQSVQRPQKYDEVPATVNAALSAMLQYMLSVSRFAHYLKVIGRDRVGSFASAAELESCLNKWLLKYASADQSGDAEARARYPLREARVQVRELPGKPGSYACVAHLRPHFQLDQMIAAVKLVTVVAPAQT